MTNLETALSFYQSFLTEKELEDLRAKAVMMTSPEEAVGEGISYATLLNNNLFELCFERYKFMYEGEQRYLNGIRESGL